MSYCGKKVLIGVISFLFLIGNAFAENNLQPDQVTHIQSDLTAIYDNWRKETPQSPVTYDAFRLYLELHRTCVKSGDDLFPICNQMVFRSGLPSGYIIVDVSKADGPNLANFVIKPGGLSFPEEKSMPGTVFIMDASGQVSPP